MTAAADETAGKRLLGFATGMAFGALLQRGGLASHDAIVDQLRLRDARVGIAMATGVASGAVGVHLLVRSGRAEKRIKPMQVGGIVGGAVLFGVGLAVLGYCPGTSVAAVGAGRRDALAGVLGMLAGAVAFVGLYPRLEPVIAAGGDFGKVTVPAALARARRRAIAPAGIRARAFPMPPHPGASPTARSVR